MKEGVYMSEKEMLQRNVEDFSRVQDWMLLADQESEVYKAMKKRYIDLGNSDGIRPESDGN